MFTNAYAFLVIFSLLHLTTFTCLNYTPTTTILNPQKLLQQILHHPMQLSWMAFPFPYADLKSPFVPSRSKNTVFHI
jgi:hypothetical protein